MKKPRFKWTDAICSQCGARKRQNTSSGVIFCRHACESAPPLTVTELPGPGDIIAIEGHPDRVYTVASVHPDKIECSGSDDEPGTFVIRVGWDAFSLVSPSAARVERRMADLAYEFLVTAPCNRCKLPRVKGYICACGWDSSKPYPPEET